MDVPRNETHPMCIYLRLRVHFYCQILSFVCKYSSRKSTTTAKNSYTELSRRLCPIEIPQCEVPRTSN